MALTKIRYASGQPDIVIAVTASPGNMVENLTPLAGTGGSNGFSATVLKAPDNVAQPSSGFAWGLYDWVTLYPLDSDGTAPDAEIRFAIGNYQPNNLVLRADYETQMFPEPRHLRAGRREQVHASVDVRAQFLASGQGVQAAPNLPLMLAGTQWIPATLGFALRVRSQAGWGQSGTAKAPLIFMGWLSILTEDELQAMWPWLHASSDYGLSYGPGGSVSGHFDWPTGGANGLTTSEVIGRFPGGVLDQQVTFTLTSAVNALAITANQRYVLSNQTAISGATASNVAAPEYDLGYALRKTTEAFVPTLIGFRFADSLQTSGSALPSIYLSYTVNGETVPDPNQNGVLVTAGTNLLQWGSTAPILNDTGEFFPMVAQSQFVKVLNYAQDMAPQVYSPVGLAAGTVRWLQGGYHLRGVQQGVGADIAP